MQKLWSSKKDEDKEIVAGVEHVEEEDLKSNATLFGTLTSIFTKKDTIEAEAESKMEEPVEDADVHAEKQTENESKKHVRQASLLETVSAMLFRTSASVSAENSDEESASQEDGEENMEPVKLSSRQSSLIDTVSSMIFRKSAGADDDLIDTDEEVLPNIDVAPATTPNVGVAPPVQEVDSITDIDQAQKEEEVEAKEERPGLLKSIQSATMAMLFQKSAVDPNECDHNDLAVVLKADVGEKELICFVCALKIEEDAYACRTCHKTMHQLCAQIKPDPLQLPNEPVSRQDSITDISQCTHQFLVAHDFTKVNFGICAVCNDPIDEPGSKCELCALTFHRSCIKFSKCATCNNDSVLNKCVSCDSEFCKKCMSSRTKLEDTDDSKAYLCHRCFRKQFKRIQHDCDEDVEEAEYDEVRAKKCIALCHGAYYFESDEDWYGELGYTLLSRSGTESVVACVVKNRDTHEVSVVFRGTCNISNLMTDLHFSMISFPGHPHVLLHKGFLKAYMRVRKSIFESLSQNFEPDDRLFVTGHSLGGALAAICFWDLHHNLLSKGSMYAFGAPRMGNEIFVNSLPENCFFARNLLDPIPRLPPLGLFRYHENQKLVEYSKTDEYVVNPSYSYWDLAKQFARLQVNMKFHSVYLGMTVADFAEIMQKQAVRGIMELSFNLSDEIIQWHSDHEIWFSDSEIPHVNLEELDEVENETDKEDG